MLVVNCAWAQPDRVLRARFEAELAGDPAAAERDLAAVLERPWVGELNFRESCALARSLPAAAKLVLATGLHNPALALRESEEYLPLADGNMLFERFVMAAPDEAMSLASGTTKPAREMRDRLAAGPPQLALLARLSEQTSIDLPRRGRVAILSGRIARGELSEEAALKIAGSTQRFIGAAVDLRTSATGADAVALDRALENESLSLCRAAQDSLAGTLARDFNGMRVRDLYAVLALGRAEATPPVFAAVFDRLLLPRLKAEGMAGASLVQFLNQTKNWELRDFAAGALAAHRFDAVLSVVGREVVDRLALRLDDAADPLREAMRVAEIVDAVTSPALRQQMAAVVSAEFARCREAGDTSGTTIYGLLAAKLAMDAIDGPYLPFFRSSETLDTALLFGPDNDCIERHFFYDDEDGIASFESFRENYEGDPLWQIEDRGEYIHITGRGPDGRRIEIFANVPIDGHLPKNRALDEARRRQQAITEALKERGLVPTVLVHRGHSFWVDRTISYVAKTARLVILGSCGGTTEVHSVIEASHDAQVIATRGIGATEINDGILKSVNDRILRGGRVIQWSAFWGELRGEWGRSGLFRDYVAPNQDSGTVLLRAYYRFLEAAN